MLFVVSCLLFLFLLWLVGCWFLSFFVVFFVGVCRCLMLFDVGCNVLCVGCRCVLLFAVLCYSLLCDVGCCCCVLFVAGCCSLIVDVFCFRGSLLVVGCCLLLVVCLSLLCVVVANAR